MSAPRILACNMCGTLYSEVQRGEGDTCWVAGVAHPSSPSQFTGCEGKLRPMRMILRPEAEVADAR